MQTSGRPASGAHAPSGRLAAAPAPGIKERFSGRPGRTVVKAGASGPIAKRHARAALASSAAPRGPRLASLAAAPRAAPTPARGARAAAACLRRPDRSLATVARLAPASPQPPNIYCPPTEISPIVGSSASLILNAAHAEYTIGDPSPASPVRQPAPRSASPARQIRAPPPQPDQTRLAC